MSYEFTEIELLPSLQAQHYHTIHKYHKRLSKRPIHHHQLILRITITTVEDDNLVTIDHISIYVPTNLVCCPRQVLVL